ncbi:MAG: PD-(D/E)XK nuclease family protein [Acidobacteria bacterium]|nr:PD-(D/E)XK nuclease family protein [Acidobacteriota bacterium]
MSSNLVLGPSFPVLLDRLLEQLRQCCRHDPLAPKWVVLPTPTAANHFRIKLGQGAEKAVFSGVRVIPLLTFIRRLGGLSEPTAAPRWGPALELLLFELVEQLPLSSPLAQLQRMPSGYRLLRPTFLDLADGGFGPDQLEILEELADEPELAAVERETIQLYAGWIRLLNERQLGWEPIAHQRIHEWIMESDEKTLLAALACEQGQTPQVLVYGFYGFTDVSAQIIAALGRRTDLTMFYPFLEEGKETHPAFSFGQAVLEDLKVRFGTALSPLRNDTDPDGKDEKGSLPQTTRFFLSTFPEGEVPPQPPFLTFQYASSIRAEVLSAALRVRQWMDDSEQPIHPEEIMVVAPDTAPYLEVTREVFAAFAIPLRMVDTPVGLTPENRPLRMLARIWEDRAPAEWILAYLRDYPEARAARDVNLDAFEWKVRQLGVWGGTSWHSILRLEADTDVKERHFLQFTSREEALVRELLDLWVNSSSGQERTFTPKQADHFLHRLKGWLPEPALLDPLLKALHSMESFRPDLVIRESMLREMLLQSVDDQVRTDPADRVGVLFVPSMRARSLTSRAIVLLGLASGTWPSRIEEDPLLSDASRRRLIAKAREVGHLLPLKSHATEEMSLLFFLLNSSAQRVHWVIPECDETGRSVAPTPWVQRYIQRWQQDLGSERLWRRIPRGPAQQAEFLLDLDRDRGAFLPPGFLFLIQPDRASLFSSEIPYAYLFAAQESRQRELAWNGHIPAASLPLSGKQGERVGVTDLESLAKCPYRFYANCSVEWKPLIPLQFADRLGALDWGSLVHSFLEHLIQPSLNQKVPVREIAQAMLRGEAEELNQTAREFFSPVPQALEVLPSVFRQAELEKLVETVKNYFQEVVKETCTGEVAIELELKRRVPFPGLEGLLISGQIDRIDQRNGHFYIFDYKSGRAVNGKQLQREVSLGYRMQPILYPWIFRHEKSKQPEAAFSFIFLGESPPQEKAVNDHPGVEELLRPLAEILSTGMYLPTPTETLKLHEIEGANSCQFCEYTSLCRRLDGSASSRYFKFSQEQLSSRLEAMKDSGQRKQQR